MLLNLLIATFGQGIPFTFLNEVVASNASTPPAYAFIGGTMLEVCRWIIPADFLNRTKIALWCGHVGECIKSRPGRQEQF